MTLDELKQRIERILKPAINTEAPYAKVMVSMLVQLAIEYKLAIVEYKDDN